MASRKNPPLVIFGNPAGKPRGESNAWRVIMDLAEAIYDKSRDKSIKDRADKIMEIAEEMYGQVKEGIHTNPAGKKKILIGKHLQAIIYIHARDGERYVHGFGNAPIRLQDFADGSVKIGGLKEQTGVEVYGSPDGRSAEICGTR